MWHVLSSTSQNKSTYLYIKYVWSILKKCITNTDIFQKIQNSFPEIKVTLLESKYNACLLCDFTF